jgi:E3 ubiquitin-protein ligase SHPRH
VVDVDLDGQTVEQAQEICILQITELEGEIRTRENRRVYLENLSARPNQADEDDGTCVLCKTEFTQGFLTPCAQ